ncbi:MAG: hypothetical protein V1704_02735 [Candidatus Vogelbacteria bacterium]
MEPTKNGNLVQSAPLINRPTIITIICVFGFVAVLFILSSLFMSSARLEITQQYGSTFLPITIFTTLLGLIGLVGYWKMRKWGVYFYTAMVVVSITHGLIVGISGIQSYIGPLVIVLVGLINLERMN